MEGLQPIPNYAATWCSPAGTARTNCQVCVCFVFNLDVCAHLVCDVQTLRIDLMVTDLSFVAYYYIQRRKRKYAFCLFVFVLL